MSNQNILDHGAKGDGETDDAAAIQATIDKCAAAGGGRVVVPAGRTFVAGPFELRSKVDFHLEHGSCVVANPERGLYADKVFPDWEDGTKWIHATGAEDIAVTGSGVIDGRGRAFVADLQPRRHWPASGRPFMLNFEDCRRITMETVTLRDSAFWAVHLLGCDDALFNGIRILNNPLMPNCDGIDPHRSRNVRIIGCYIEAGDDCICPKSEAGFEHYGATEDIIATGCTLVSSSCAIKIGSGTYGEFRRMIFDSCIIRNSNRGLGIQLRDGGVVEDVIFSNMFVETRFGEQVWWGDATPVYLTAFEREPGAPLGVVRDIRFANIACRSENGVYIAANKTDAIRDITFDNVSVKLDRWTTYPGGNYDRRPSVMEPERSETPTSGFHFDTARDITVRDCSVTWGENLPEYYRHALCASDVTGLTTERLKGDAAFPDRYEAVVTE